MKTKIVMLGTTEYDKVRLSKEGVLSYEPHIKGLHYSGTSHIYQHLYLIDPNAEIKELPK